MKSFFFVVISVFLGCSSVEYPSTESDIGPQVLFLGDEVVGEGSWNQSYPVLAIVNFNRRMEMRRIAVRAGGVYDEVVGSTTATVSSRMKAHLQEDAKRPRVLVLTLGLNDDLREIPVIEIERNLEDALRIAEGAGVTVILCGLKSRSKHGEYSAAFDSLFPRLAKKHGTFVLPFPRERVTPDDVKGHRELAEALVPLLERALKTP